MKHRRRSSRQSSLRNVFFETNGVISWISTIRTLITFINQTPFISDPSIHPQTIIILMSSGYYRWVRWYGFCSIDLFHGIAIMNNLFDPWSFFVTGWFFRTSWPIRCDQFLQLFHDGVFLEILLESLLQDYVSCETSWLMDYSYITGFMTFAGIRIDIIDLRFMNSGYSTSFFITLNYSITYRWMQSMRPGLAQQL